MPGLIHKLLVCLWIDFAKLRRIPSVWIDAAGQRTCRARLNRLEIVQSGARAPSKGSAWHSILRMSGVELVAPFNCRRSLTHSLPICAGALVFCLCIDFAKPFAEAFVWIDAPDQQAGPYAIGG
jgi:hypothetical protein